ncbi:hypothetical protein [Aureimonas glaciei]|uniref:Uncharacterized protein n=1 Tax=Aureimonas glaciei TaxID=1776957 RepID=A0A917DDQ2_9HYPH|nr:hypothetical protein [Aureimonas glaciei]GGD28601.1 hypothetical protein GCM10011335_34740 [Aureimonas glaciei]
MEMTPGQLVFHAKLVAEDGNADFAEAALATRFGQHGTDAAWRDVLKGQ